MNATTREPLNGSYERTLSFQVTFLRLQAPHITFKLAYNFYFLLFVHSSWSAHLIGSRFFLILNVIYTLKYLLMWRPHT